MLALASSNVECLPVRTPSTVSAPSALRLFVGSHGHAPRGRGAWPGERVTKWRQIRQSFILPRGSPRTKAEIKQMLTLERLQPESIPPTPHPVERCCYCWYVLHPTISYPEAWSSTVCDEHSLWVLAQRAASAPAAQREGRRAHDRPFPPGVPGTRGSTSRPHARSELAQ